MAEIIDLDLHRDRKERREAAEKMEALKRDGIELDLVRLRDVFFSNRPTWRDKNGNGSSGNRDNT